MSSSPRSPLVLTDPALIADVARKARRVAVLGIKPETHASQPAHSVPKYLVDHGVTVIPVPVYYPDVREILGIPVVRSLREVRAPIDIVDVFRRAEDIDEHVDDLIALAPAAVWFQLGIVNDAAADKLAEAGILVVQNRCLMVEHRNATF